MDLDLEGMGVTSPRELLDGPGLITLKAMLMLSKQGVLRRELEGVQASYEAKLKESLGLTPEVSAKISAKVAASIGSAPASTATPAPAPAPALDGADGKRLQWTEITIPGRPDSG